MLHTVNKSPFERNSLQSCLGFASPDQVLLLYEDGIYAALKGTSVEPLMTEALKKLKIYVLTADLEARGMRLENVIAGIQPTDYNGFVDLVVAHNPIQAWL